MSSKEFSASSFCWGQSDSGQNGSYVWNGPTGHYWGGVSCVALVTVSLKHWGICPPRGALKMGPQAVRCPEGAARDVPCTPTVQQEFRSRDWILANETQTSTFIMENRAVSSSGLLILTTRTSHEREKLISDYLQYKTLSAPCMKHLVLCKVRPLDVWHPVQFTYMWSDFPNISFPGVHEY